MTWASVYIKSSPALYLGTFYSSILAFPCQANCFDELDLSISRLPNNCHIILASDFILLDVDWSKKFVVLQICYSSYYNQLMNTVHDYNLHQVVTIFVDEDNILDLVFTYVPFCVQIVSILPGLVDHDIVCRHYDLTCQN